MVSCDTNPLYKWDPLRGAHIFLQLLIKNRSERPVNANKQTSREPVKQCLEGPGRVKIGVRTGTATRSRKSPITSELNCKYQKLSRMVPGQHAPDAHRNLTSKYNFSCSHPISIWQNQDHGAPFCLGENPDFKRFDLCYSFKTLVRLDYGGFGQLHQAAWNYRNNRVAAFTRSEDNRMSYEKALRNLIVFSFAHHIEAFECHGARQGHRAILALECLTVADELGRYHSWYKRADLRKPGIEKTHWKDLPSVPQEDHRSSYASRLAELGSPKQPSYGHPQKLGRYFDHVYHQSRNVGQLTRKSRDQDTGYNETVYTRELGEILSYLSGFGDLSRTPRHKKTLASLLNLEIILPEADFQALWGQDSGWIGDESWAEGEQIQPFEHDGLQTWADWVGDPEEL